MSFQLSILSIVLIPAILVLVFADFALPQQRFDSRVDRTGKAAADSVRFTRSGAWPHDDEKAVSVAPNVYVSFCVRGAPVKVSGWGRDEVRVFLKGRSGIGLKIRERDEKTKKPVWIEVFSKDSREEGGGIDGCINGSLLELDIPESASVTVTGNAGDTSVEIDAVKKAKIDIVGGDISLSNIAYGIDAHTDVGGVSVRNSKGRMFVTTTAGNIVAYDTSANETGDYFRAKTISGAITMQSVGQKEVEANSLSGSITYLGNTKPNGNYSFSTTNGLITLALPSDSGFKLKAAFGGDFKSELALTNLEKTPTASAVYLSGLVGTDNGAAVSIRSYNGTIKIIETNGKSQIPPDIP